MANVSTSPINITNSSNAAAMAALMDPSTMAGVHAYQDGGEGDDFIVCYSPTMITTNGIWKGSNPLDYSLPLFILQSMLIIIVTRGLNVVLCRFRQPKFVAEVIGGIILGPSMMGMIPYYMDVVFPLRSQPVLETIGDLGLVYFIFLVGLQVDLGSFNRAGKKVWAITAASIVLPFIVEIVAFFLFGEEVSKENYADSYLVFISVSISITAYPVLIRILAEVKLLNTETGRLAMSAAILANGVAWVLLTIAIAMTDQDRSMVASFAVIISGVIFVVFMYYAIRPAIHWATTQNEAEPIDGTLAQVILMGVMVSAIVADFVGIHAVFGAFMMGVMIPNGPLVSFLMEKMDDFVTGILLPMFFAIVGIKVEVASLDTPGVYGFLIGVATIAGIAKVTATCMASMLFGVPRRDGLTLGILMNTKGIMELIVLHIALDKKVLYTQSYSTMILVSVVMTVAVTPLTLFLCRPPRCPDSSKRRMIQQAKPAAELRMIACIHNTRNVPSITSFLEISNPTKETPIFVYCVHLVELTGRESAMLIVHDTQDDLSKRCRSDSSSIGDTSQLGCLNRIQAQSDHIIKVFRRYEQQKGGISVEPLTVVSAYSTMHEDVWDLVKDKDVALIILPFHKHQTLDGELEETNPGIRTFNRKVLADAPCSVGILVDRGIGINVASSSSIGSTTHQVAMIFIGGPDDREALAYVARVVDQPGVSLHVLRLVDTNQEAINDCITSIRANTSSETSDGIVNEQGKEVDFSTMRGKERERFLDDECIKDFQTKTTGNEQVEYREKKVARGDDVLSEIRCFDRIYDLYVVGRGCRVGSDLMAGMEEWTESLELGAIGDWLASQDFTAAVSVLVIQQYVAVDAGTSREGSEASATPDNQRQLFLRKSNNNNGPRITKWGP